MSISHLLFAIALLGLLIFRQRLDTHGKASTRLLALAMAIGILGFSAQALLLFFNSTELSNGVLLVTDTLYVLFFLLLALHFTGRKLPVAGYWLPQALIYLAIVFTATLILIDENFNSVAYQELIRTLLFLTATLAFVTITRSMEMLNHQPVFWIPTLIIATGYGLATAGKLASTLLHFAGYGNAGLILIISSSLGIVAMLLLLIFLAANISWFRNTL